MGSNPCRSVRSTSSPSRSIPVCATSLRRPWPAQLSPAALPSCRIRHRQNFTQLDKRIEVIMNTPSFSLVNNANGEKVDLPAVSGTLGPVGLDVGKVYGKTGVFTYDPGFSSTCSTQSAITYIDGYKGVLQLGRAACRERVCQ